MEFNRETLLSMFAPAVKKATFTSGSKTQDIYVKELSAAEVFRMQDEGKAENASGRKFGNKLLAAALCNEKGEAIMTEQQADEMANMTISSYDALVKLVGVECGLTKADDEGKV